ncbi:tRNA (adenosine(37)-N6)-threonylcarbamoyltransferase complex ATPase subunit type 1 TsaE [Paenibacillus glycanilyticus]|uniref:tRNA (adenosine(37)-N6)-threonylcarbamoyltransferase complex ATPase subunit type 1 TsaE n=1 Tax=Paenibacillus glycanilyticus TaxID=126569 RepID=UPI00203E49F8|nr:tRNA (adenosine(37)-N6)-threonylcarbamoyltransferase complex ATPase subunit type 1 TsaE [Paenibacillus glycanilyticus]MCM3630951.1 tRNA (adenosine(37)-N6)-threonylcarbamoyltransferase complex ATPase subunit type 1 TsaE [Paenibacillus glycanilyticus]
MTSRGQIVLTVRSEQETALLAQRIAELVKPGTVLALDGDLGAGKTTFSQKFAKAIGVTDVVNSPTFTIIKEYEGASMPFYHMDVYRLSLEEADELGLDDYFFGSGVTIVEWASLIEELLPPERLEMYIAHEGSGGRVFRINGIGEPYASWCEALNEMGAGNNDDRA